MDIGSSRKICLLLLAALPFAARSSLAQEAALRLGREDVIELASTQGPEVAISARQADETRGLLAGARVLLRENPTIELSRGQRRRPGESLLEDEIALDLPLEIYGQRGLRIDAAELAVDRDQTLVDEAKRRLVAEALAAFYRSLRAEAEVGWATQQVTLAEELLRIAERRQRAGDIGDLDLRVARVEAARAKGRVRAASAERETAVAVLRVALGVASDRAVTLEGSLAEGGNLYAGDLLQRPPRDRPDVRASEIAVRAGQAELSSEGRLAWPNPALRLTHEREEGADVFLAGIALPLPFFQRNQGSVAEARARVARLETERDYARLRADVELAAAQRRFRLAREALDIFEGEAVALLDDNLRLAQRSYEVGQSSLAELLTVRREVLETRREHFDALLELAVAGVELEAALGVLP